MNRNETREIKAGQTGKWRNHALFVLLIVFLAIPALVFAEISAAKISIKQDGYYRVAATNLAVIFSKTVSEIQTMPFAVMNLGKEVASVRDNGDVIFYALSYVTPQSDENVFWIVPENPAPVPSINVTAGSTPYQGSLPVSKRFEQHLVIRADLITNLNEDPILWRMLTSGLATKTYTATITLDSLASGTGGSLSVRLKGATDITGRFYHRARVDLNGVTLGYIDFNGLESKEVSFPVTAGQWVAGNNSVKVESTPPPGTTFDSFFLDYINANYQRTFASSSNRISMPIATGSIQATGFSNTNIVLWNVTDQWNIRKVTGHQIIQNGGTWNVTFNTTEQGVYAATTKGAELIPLRIEPFTDIGLKDTSWSLDHLVIAHTSLVESAEQLTYYRESAGLDSATITVDDIYDAFNYGIRDARAIERFLKYAYRNWTKHPRYVVLVGDGSLDDRNLLGYGDSLIPAFPLIGPNGLYGSDYKYGDPTGAGQVEMAVGRIPVKSSALVDDYIDKLVNYETGGSWRTNNLISTDQNDYGGDFLGIGNQLSSMINGNVYRGDLTTQTLSAVRSAVIDGINQGREVSMYVGHGTPNQLSQQSILLVSDIPQFTNSVSPTAFVAIGCLIGAFNDPGKVNLGEGMVTAKGGASSVIAAGTLISAADGQVLSEKFLTDIYNDGVSRLGDAWISGKNQLTADSRHPAFKAFQFLGDPAAAVGNPEAPRMGEGTPSMPGFSEWAESVLPPALEDMGQVITENSDMDGDLFNDYSEYKAGTDPFDPGAFLEVVKIKRPNPQTVELRWPSAVDRTYTIESAASIFGPYSLVTNGVTASAPLNINAFAETSSNPRFYRITVE